jgi:hypothetical protein
MGVLALLRRSIAVLLGLLALGAGACAKPAPTNVLGTQVTRQAPTTATLHGVVHDSGGQPHPGAIVTLEGLGLHLDGTADAAGAYQFSNLPAGTYVLTVNSSDATTPGTGAVRLGETTRSSRKEITLRLGDNLIDAESGF